MILNREVLIYAAALAALLAPASRAPAQSSLPSVDFSGVMYPQFRWQNDDATKAANGGHAASRFDIERIYLNFRMPAGEDGSIRVTTDLYNNATSCTDCYGGWTLRLKYGYFDYAFLHDIRGLAGFNASARLGMLPTPVINHEEGFWPRWISQVAVDRNRFFSSSDLGAGMLLTLPKKWGELYAAIVNGGGYTATESDPYKDVSARLSITPWGAADGLLKTFVISPWVYAGKTASRFISTPGSAGTSVANGLTRDRSGVFIGLKDRRLTAGIEWATRTETIETGTTPATRGTYDNSGALRSAFALVRPAEWFGDPTVRSPWGVLARADSFTRFDNAAAAGLQTTSARNALLILGVWWDLNERASFSLDAQHLAPRGGSATPESRILFLHGEVRF